ncbi:NDR1/HIN1-like protein 10 [Impatiens glandulifera]|uniref:NDR1/HIN1-like protein 10 n=1 Tax=Impatiens glandulifera TaxID=253017 RepID=UPI001FB11CC7|nr:NDR1/HIN1-like protein 10 [Impatiens glandulifera]
MTDQSRPAAGYPATGYPAPQPAGYSNAGNAYPYAVPPQTNPPYYNQNPYYAQPYDNRRALLRRIFAIIIATFIIAGTIAFITWLILRPHLPEVRIDSFSVSNLNLSSSPSLITGNWDVRFTVRNPNKKINLYYDVVNAYAYYQGEELSDTTLAPFSQGKKVETQGRATLAASSKFIDKWVIDGINGEKSRGGSVNFNVRMLSRVQFKAGFWWARRRYVRVYCGDLIVGFGSNGNSGNLTSGVRQCKVG